MYLHHLTGLSVIQAERTQCSKGDWSQSKWSERQMVNSRPAAAWSTWTGRVVSAGLSERRRVCQVEGFLSAWLILSSTAWDDSLWRVDNRFGHAEPHGTPCLCFWLKFLKSSTTTELVIYRDSLMPPCFVFFCFFLYSTWLWGCIRRTGTERQRKMMLGDYLF